MLSHANVVTHMLSFFVITRIEKRELEEGDSEMLLHKSTKVEKMTGARELRDTATRYFYAAIFCIRIEFIVCEIYFKMISYLTPLTQLCTLRINEAAEKRELFVFFFATISFHLSRLHEILIVEFLLLLFFFVMQFCDNQTNEFELNELLTTS